MSAFLHTTRGLAAFHLVAVAIVGIWGLTFISTKLLIGQGMSPHEIFLLRFLMAYAGIWFLAPRRLWADSWRDELWLLLGGVTGGSFYFLTENTALEYTLATNVAFLVCTTPLLTTLLSLALYKNVKATRGLIGGSLVALAGVALVVCNGHFVLRLSPVGDLLSLLASLSWAVYSLVMRRMADRYDVTFITRKIFFYGVLTILPVFLFRPWQFEVARLLDTAILCHLLFLGVPAEAFLGEGIEKFLPLLLVCQPDIVRHPHVGFITMEELAVQHDIHICRVAGKPHRLEYADV